MHHALIGIAAGLSNDELVRRLPLLAGRERDATIELLAHLGVLDERRLHVPLGYGSLFAYCTGVLRLGEHAAYNRIEAARACRRFPDILDRLATGSLNLSTLRLLAPHLTLENHRLVLDEASGKSKREVEVLVAGLAPRPDTAPLVRRLPPWDGDPRVLRHLRGGRRGLRSEAAAGDPGHREAGPEPVAIEPASDGAGPRFERPVVTEKAGPPQPAVAAGVVSSLDSAVLLGGETAAGRHPRRSHVTPLSPERYRLQVTVGREAYQDLRSLQDLLRREIPDGDPGCIVERALRLLVDDVARKKVAAASRPRPRAAGPAPSRHVPAEAKRTVWLRDGGRCAFVARGGRRCGERAFLEFHHIEPYALGGETIASNLALRCRAHNRYEAEVVFGEAKVERSGATPRPTRPGASDPPRNRCDQRE